MTALKDRALHERESPPLSIDAGREKLLRAIGSTGDVTFLRGHGNVGDDLIHAGTRQLLSGIDYREASVLRLDGVIGGTALLSGSGAWCHAFHAMPRYLAEVEERFERVIVLPSTFDITAEGVAETLGRTRAKVFAREMVSYEKIRDLCDADFAHDTALYFDFSPYRRTGRGTLSAYRDDGESARRIVLPADNDDISVTCETLDEWLWTIARHERILTDRAHVTIAAAMLGKRVEYAASNYHKVPAIVEFSLQELDVARVEPSSQSAAVQPLEAASAATAAAAASTGFRESREADRREHAGWLDRLRRTREEVESLVPPGEAFVFVDGGEWGREPVAIGRRVIPFTEKDGVYWGQPADDAAAIAELTRLRQEGANYLLFAWPAFWWLDYYEQFAGHLHRQFRQIWRNERLIAFDLRS